MTYSIAFVTPQTDTVIDATSQSIVIDVLDTTPNPIREINVTLGSIIFTRIGGTTTFLNAAYTVGVSSPATNTTRYTLTKITPWTNPDTLQISATYDPNGVDPVVNAAVDVVVADFETQSSDPYDQQPDVRPETAITFTVASNATFRGGRIYVEDVLALTLDANNLPQWSFPNFNGSAVLSAGLLTITIKPRRIFSPDERVTIRGEINLTEDLAIEGVATFEYNFYVRTRVTSLLNSALRFTSLDRPFNQLPALELQRQVLVSNLKTRPVSPGAEVLIFLRITRCSLKSVSSQFQRPDLEKEMARIVPEDIADINAVALAINEITVLWEPALREAHELHVNPLLLDLVAKTYNAPYPQEKVGAVAALLLAVSAQLATFTA